MRLTANERDLDAEHGADTLARPGVGIAAHHKANAVLALLLGLDPCEREDQV